MNMNTSKSKQCKRKVTVTIEEEDAKPMVLTQALLPVYLRPYPTSCLKIIDNEDQDDDDSTSLLHLAKHVFRKLSKKRNWNPTPIQLQSWPILEQTSLNLIAIAPTGSGKTLGYSMPMVHSCMESISQHQESNRHRGKKADRLRRRVHGLVLLPTRELAIQVFQTLKIVAKSANQLAGRTEAELISAMVLYGGVDRGEQIDSLSQKKEFILAATPLRLIDLLGIGEDMVPNERVQALFETTKYLVIDEADTMAIKSDMKEQVDLIVDFLRDKSCSAGDVKKCLFSATLPRRAVTKCDKWIDMPRATVKVDTVTVGREQEELQKKEASNNATNAANGRGNKDGKSAAKEKTGKAAAAACRGPLDVSTIPAHITQILHVCSNNEKPKKLIDTITKIRNSEKEQGSRRKGLIIVYFAKIKTLESRYLGLLKEKISCVPFHGQMKQMKREQQLNEFKCGKMPILLTTDIAARGIHCNNVEYVINYDFPESIEQYVHRSGRCGRNKGSSGSAAGKGNSNSNDTVYSYFNQELAPLAGDLIDLLRSCNSWVDPNLISLIPDRVREGGESLPKKRKHN